MLTGSITAVLQYSSPVYPLFVQLSRLRLNRYRLTGTLPKISHPQRMTVRSLTATVIPNSDEFNNKLMN